MRQNLPTFLASRSLRVAAVALLAVVIAGCAASEATRQSLTASGCPSWQPADYANARVIRKLRVYTNPATGDSAVEETVMTPRSTPLLKTGQMLVEYDFGASSKTQIVYGPANLFIAAHPSPYRESFLILQGSVTMRLGDGTTVELLPGDMTTNEDMDARRGHGGTTGPCGYVALNIVP